MKANETLLVLQFWAFDYSVHRGGFRLTAVALSDGARPTRQLCRVNVLIPREVSKNYHFLRSCALWLRFCTFQFDHPSSGLSNPLALR